VSFPTGAFKAPAIGRSATSPNGDNLTDELSEPYRAIGIGPLFGATWVKAT